MIKRLTLWEIPPALMIKLEELREAMRGNGWYAVQITMERDECTIDVQEYETLEDDDLNDTEIKRFVPAPPDDDKAQKFLDQLNDRRPIKEWAQRMEQSYIDQMRSPDA